MTRPALAFSIAFSTLVSLTPLPALRAQGEAPAVPAAQGGTEPPAQRAQGGTEPPPPAEADGAVALPRAATPRELELLHLAAIVDGELVALAAHGLDPDEAVVRAQRILAELDRREAGLLESDEGRRRSVQVLMRVAELLSTPAIGERTLAVRAAQRAVGLVEGAPVGPGGERAAMALVGELHVGRGRIALSSGNVAAAIEELEQGIELLRNADKGRGTGRGNAEQQGTGEGLGGGQRRGKGANKEKSLHEKRYIASAYRDLQRAYRLAGDSEQELGAFARERQVVGNICQMEFGAGGMRFGLARGEMAELIDRLGDATARGGDRSDAINVEVLAGQIWREVSESLPEHAPFLEALLEQEVEIARRRADLAQARDLRLLATQVAQDLTSFANRGGSFEQALGYEARVAFEVGRGMAEASRIDGSDALRSEALSWLSRATELVESVRAGGGTITRLLRETEEAASRELATLEASPRTSGG